MRSPILNPIRFYKVGDLPNWTTRFPNPDNIKQRIEYTKGVFQSLWYKEFIEGRNLRLQMEREGVESTIMTVYKYNAITELYEVDSQIAGTDITPSGWDGKAIYSFTKNFTEGAYYLSLSGGVTSDVFFVSNSVEQKKHFVDIVYSHHENDYGCIFANSFEFSNFFQGQLLTGQPESDIEAFTTDRGQEIKLESLPKRVLTLNINEVHHTYIQHLNMIFSVSNIKVNGIEVTNVESVQVELIENSDLANVTVQLYVNDNDYYYKFNTEIK